MYHGYIYEFGRIDKKEWDSAVKIPVYYLRLQIFEILKLRESILKYLTEDIRELVNKNENMRKIFLGGVDQYGEYGKYSLAKIIKDILGISIDTKKFMLSDVDITYDICDTSFLIYMRAIISCSDRIIGDDYRDMFGHNPVVTTESILENPKLIKELLSSIYQNSVQISANVNDHTFFILNTRCIPRYYIESVYPKIKNSFEELAKILDLEPIYIPEIDDDKIRNDYTLWGHKKGGFADSIFILNRLIWNMPNINEDLVTRNFSQLYEDNIKRSLLRVSWCWPIHEPQIDYTMRMSYPYWSLYCKISGVNIVESHLIPSWKNMSPVLTRLQSRSIMELFDEISPALLLGRIIFKNDYDKDMQNLCQNGYLLEHGLYIDKNHLIIDHMFKHEHEGE